jgi:hypothetical protein
MDPLVAHTHDCWALTSLTDQNRMKVATQGGIEAIMAAMPVHLVSVAVQTNCCYAMANVANNNDANQLAI